MGRITNGLFLVDISKFIGTLHRHYVEEGADNVTRYKFDEDIWERGIDVVNLLSDVL